MLGIGCWVLGGTTPELIFTSGSARHYLQDMIVYPSIRACSRPLLD